VRRSEEQDKEKHNSREESKRKWTKRRQWGKNAQPESVY